MVEYLQHVDGDCLFNLIKLEQEIAELDESRHVDEDESQKIYQAMLHYTFADIINTL